MSKKATVKQAVIVAGGKGERLRPLTNDKPKPMVLVNGRPFLEYLIEMLRENGITEVLLLVGYKGEKIVEHFGDGSKFGIKIKYSIGIVEENNGTRLRNAAHLLQKHFLFIYGDIYWPLDLEKHVNFYNKYNALGMMTVYNNKDHRGEYGKKNLVQITTSGYINQYGPFEDHIVYLPTFQGIDIGYYILNKKVVGLMPEEDFEFQGGLVSGKLIANKELLGFGTDQYYCTLTNVDFLKKAEKFLASKKVIFINHDVLVNKSTKSKFSHQAIEALRLLEDKDYQIFVMANLSHKSITPLYIKSSLLKHNIHIQKIYSCPHGHKDQCECRMPKAGMFFRATGDYHIDLRKTIFIDHDKRGLIIGEETGCKTYIVSPKNSLLQIVKKIVSAK